MAMFVKGMERRFDPRNCFVNCSEIVFNVLNFTATNINWLPRLLSNLWNPYFSIKFYFCTIIYSYSIDLGTVNYPRVTSVHLITNAHNYKVKKS